MIVLRGQDVPVSGLRVFEPLRFRNVQLPNQIA